MLLLAFGSGLAALIYEIVWFQLLELVVGSTALSVGILAATFMGGTGLGALVFPRLVSMRHRPLRVYAAIELGIGALGILALFLIPLTGSLYTAWSGYGLSGLLLRGMVAAVCLLPSTMLMGATLPALARQVGPDSSRLGLLYGANIAGAVCGCLLAGFYLLRLFDAATATYIAVAANIAVAALAIVLARGTAPVNVEARRENRGATVDVGVYVAIGLSGLCAMAAETVWTRMLGLLLGASVYTFSIVLAVFLLGLGVGSGTASVLCRSLRSPRAALGWCQFLLVVAIAWTAYALGASLPFWPINPAISSSIWFTFQLDVVRALWAVLPPTLLWGASFPLALAAARSSGEDASRLVARIYASNTLGGIVGALGASLLLVPRFGSQGAEQVLLALSAGAALLLLWEGTRARTAVVGTASILLLSGVLITTVPPVASLAIAHGRYAASWVGKGDILFAREGMNSSVAVMSFPNDVRTFHVAGKIQASSAPRDMRLQRMLGHLTTLIPDRPRSVLVIGCGAGITAGAVSIDPRVERVTIAEIEPLVPQAAAEYFARENFDVLKSPKVRFVIDDGRNYVLTSRDRFDAITIDPLDPWVKGAASLYTREFYEAMRQHLNPGGAVSMYIQLFETNTEAVKSAVATFMEVFPNGTLWGNPYQGQGHDMVLLGQVESPRIDLDQMDQRAAPLAGSLSEAGIDSTEALFATYAGRGPDLKEWLRDAAINHDANLRMQYLAGFGLDLDDSAPIYASLLRYWRFPEDIFTGSRQRVDALREAMRQDR